jgi:hypothetical protein
MPARELPARPNLEQYKKQAKDLLQGWKGRDPEVLVRVKQHHPRLRFSDSEQAKFALADAQLVVAREHGFASWSKFTHHIESLLGSSKDTVWVEAEAAVIAGDELRLQRVLREHQALFRNEQAPAYVPRGPRPDYSGLDARTIIAREHQFDSWEQFERYVAALTNNDSPVARFEAAADAVVTGDLARLEGMLRSIPNLARARSSRTHHSTLLHYVAANGIEGFRQKTPANAVTVARVLLDAGADIDAVADMYGGNARTLGLVATSIHPRLAGVQEDLMELLLLRGASFDPNGAMVNDCLANGRDAAAEFLAKRGARLDLEGAAGVGRLDIVQAFFNPDGTLALTASKTQMREGFAWACEFGRTDVVDFLVERGMEVDAKLRHHGQTGLHWAAVGGHRDTVSVLLKRGATVDAKDETWGNTPLGWALYGWSEAPADTPHPYHEIVGMLVAAGAAVKPEWLADEKVQADSKILAALSGNLQTR